MLIFSHFHEKFGPHIVLTAPEKQDDTDLDQIPALMDLYDDGFFVHIFGNYKSANFIFEIPSQHGRGNIEMLLLTILVDVNSYINFDLSKELLEGFKKEIQKIDDAYKAFYVEDKIYEKATDKLEEIKSLFYTFFSSIPEESVMYERKDAKILVFGLTNAGKTTLINCLKTEITKKTIPTTYIDISRIVIHNISLYAYDTPGQLKFRDLWTPYLKNQDGLVFVLDIDDASQYNSARDVLHEIVNMPLMEDLPLLILFNKVDIKESDIEVLNSEMRINELGNRPIKSFLTSGITGKNVDSAFYWLALKLSDRIYPSPKSDLGLIFSRWDEDKGLKLIAVYPNDAFEDPELIAIRCFSISQFIFGGEKFKRTSIILPFTHLKVKAAIYFDVIPDSSIRGGFLPLSLVIFYNEKIPRAIIDQFNIFIFEKFTHIKEHYSDRIQVLNDLNEIHEMVLRRLKSVEPTVKALRIAELRYQSLFMAARDAILILDRKSGIIVDANEQSEQLLQRTSKDIIGLHSSQLQIQDEVENFQQTIINQIKLDTPPLIELDIKNLDGKIIPVEINASEIQMGGQNLIQCILRDITERKIAEKRLKDSENKFRHLFTSSPFSIILLNPKGIVVDCNPAVEQLLGYKKEELIDNRFDKLSLLRPKYLEMLLESLRTVVKEDSITLLEVKLNKKNGESLWANVQATQVVICKESFIQIIANNITEQKKAEKALRESEFQFHKAYDRANFYKELFAQEVNNIFNKIQSSIERFKKEKRTTEAFTELNEMLELIEDQSIMGTKLVSNVRKLAFIEDTRFSMVKIEINCILQKAVTQIQGMYQDKELDIKIYPPNKEFYVRANEILTDVFENILINVIEYNKNPKIDIQILIYRRFKDDIDYLKMEFIDKEIGSSDITSGELKQKSEIQYKRSRGMLLGLSFVDQILNSLNGEIWVEGTSFVITIPEAK